MKTLLILLALALHLTAGSRHLDQIGITNATQGEEPEISKRLYELLIADTKIVLIQSSAFGFNWEPGIKLTQLPSTAKTFAPLITPKNKKIVAELIDKHKIYDGLIVYQYDQKQKVVRLKLYNYDGAELILIKIPIETEGPMKDSIYRVTRRATMVAIGGAVRFTP